MIFTCSFDFYKLRIDPYDRQIFGHPICKRDITTKTNLPFVAIYITLAACMRIISLLI